MSSTRMLRLLTAPIANNLSLVSTSSYAKLLVTEPTVVSFSPLDYHPPNQLHRMHSVSVISSLCPVNRRVGYPGRACMPLRCYVLEFKLEAGTHGSSGASLLGGATSVVGQYLAIAGARNGRRVPSLVHGRATSKNGRRREADWRQDRAG
jgi:hypothetical protein